MDQNGHARITRRDQAFRIPENGIAQQRAEPGFAQLSRSIKPTSVRFPLISVRAVPLGALGYVPAGQKSQYSGKAAAKKTTTKKKAK